MACFPDPTPPSFDSTVDTGVSTNSTASAVDADSDGYAASDCDDDDPAVNPAAVERCDGIDNDCDGMIDGPEAEDAERWYPDADGDGYGDGQSPLGACSQPEGYTSDASDCDDSDPEAYPAAAEIWFDGVDQGCDGATTCDSLDVIAVPTETATIQSAIKAAADGDVICVLAGRYTENIDFSGKAVHVLGFQGATQTTIDGASQDTVVRFDDGEGPEAILEGFTLTGGDNEDGGGIEIRQSSPTLRSLVIDGNEATNGGGIAIDSGSPTVSNVVLVWNAATDGGAVWIDGASGPAEPEFSAIFITGHNIDSTGGGIYARDAFIQITNSTIWGNYAGESGGAIYFSGEVSMEATNVDFVGNVAGEDGGAFYAESELHATFRYCNVPADKTDLWGVSNPLDSNGNIWASADHLDTTYSHPLMGDFHLSPDSPLVDGGAPGVLDPDGSISDIGAFGGPTAGEWDLDADGDPWWWQPGPYDSETYPSEGWDCDDTEPDLGALSGC